MTIRRIIELVAFCAALLIAAMALHAWLDSRDEQQRLASTLAAQKQLLDAADTRERTRQSALDDTLAQIEKLKRATLTPQQIIDALPKYVSLPRPITLRDDPASTASQSDQQTPKAKSAPEKGTVSSAKTPNSLPSANAQPTDANGALPAAPIAQVPSADLKPLYDYIQDCRACQAQLAAAKQNASDDAAKISALTTQRDAAITAAKGGTLWRRLRRNALWFAVGAAAGSSSRHRQAPRFPPLASSYRASHR
jgi:hypothetical protein